MKKKTSDSYSISTTETEIWEDFSLLVEKSMEFIASGKNLEKPGFAIDAIKLGEIAVKEYWHDISKNGGRKIMDARDAYINSIIAYKKNPKYKKYVKVAKEIVDIINYDIIYYLNY